MQNAPGGLKLSKCLAVTKLITQSISGIIIVNIYWLRFFSDIQNNQGHLTSTLIILVVRKVCKANVVLLCILI